MVQLTTDVANDDQTPFRAKYDGDNVNDDSDPKRGTEPFQGSNLAGGVPRVEATLGFGA